MDSRGGTTPIVDDDPDARLYKKATGSKRSWLSRHLLTENRHGFIIDSAVTDASGTAERDAAIACSASCR